jgi:hypothetical protein
MTVVQTIAMVGVAAIIRAVAARLGKKPIYVAAGVLGRSAGSASPRLWSRAQPGARGLGGDREHG